MAKVNKKKSGEIQAISTECLTEKVFMILYFFMVEMMIRDSN